MSVRFTVAEVIRATCQVYGLEAHHLRFGADLDIPSRKRLISAGHVVEARCVASFVARRFTGQSYPQIAGRLNYAQHTSVIYGERRIIQRIAADEPLRNRVAAVIGRLVNNTAIPAVAQRQEAAP